ncbi:hypothetical protein NBRC116493_21450 [Aurantivibrio infirmus]
MQQVFYNLIIRIALIAGLFSFGLTACVHNASKDDSLFQSLGGEIGLDQLTVTTLQLARAEDRIAFHFQDIEDDEFLSELYMQLCSLSGGPCEYEGRDMIDAHAGLGITKAEFDVFVEIFIEAMNKNAISFSAQNKLLSILAPMRPDIILQ